MTTFDERERAFENKFKHDEELLFKIQVRRAKLLGLWAAEQMRFEKPEAEAYAKTMVDADFEEAGHADLIRKVCADFEARGIDVSRHRVEKEAELLLQVAREQINNQ
ncbi:hypothetical protein N825_18895 [Skermanella stibiiresistens SB22]|uniref:Aldolase n=1 Tax=Skermanella stibiiresistens SB22 TaxID=1385369 RepID=W9HDN5_9PROT|nr:DUF1476 domain-containing protein [Skermanella stibiiresistens]EWY42008.1 hypothetical protein N825_18895 [Skermanella stibiiresistens SB22]